MGGQIPNNLALPLRRWRGPILGTARDHRQGGGPQQFSALLDTARDRAAAVARPTDPERPSASPTRSAIPVWCGRATCSRAPRCASPRTGKRSTRALGRRPIDLRDHPVVITSSSRTRRRSRSTGSPRTARSLPGDLRARRERGRPLGRRHLVVPAAAPLRRDRAAGAQSPRASRAGSG